jgi:UDP-2-acetamido-2,6-beta-L-arabino-hexul-4-ose reductase
MLKIGITGVDGFIGRNLSLAVERQPELFALVEFDRSYFTNVALLRKFVLQCDVIVHLAALSRHPVAGVVFENNVRLTKQLISAMQVDNAKPYLIFASSIHDGDDSEYARSKRMECELLGNWARVSNSNFSCLVLNNIYGPFCKPNYASFVATFCDLLSRNEKPKILVDKAVELTYIDNLTGYILNKVANVEFGKKAIDEYVRVPSDAEIKVSAVLDMLTEFKERYIEYKNKGIFRDDFQENMFKTFSSYFECNQES